MGNMSYCRFENTLGDLRDCREHLDDNAEDMNDREVVARQKLIKLCAEIANAMGEEANG